MSFHNPSFYISGTITEIYIDLKQLTEIKLKRKSVMLLFNLPQILLSSTFKLEFHYINVLFSL